MMGCRGNAELTPEGVLLLDPLINPLFARKPFRLLHGPSS